MEKQKAQGDGDATDEWIESRWRGSEVRNEAKEEKGGEEEGNDDDFHDVSCGNWW